MKLKITEVAPFVTKQYSYTHRIEIIDDDPYKSNESDAVNSWVIQNNIPCCRISYKTFYLNPASAAMFVLRWS